MTFNAAQRRLLCWFAVGVAMTTIALAGCKQDEGTGVAPEAKTVEATATTRAVAERAAADKAAAEKVAEEKAVAEKAAAETAAAEQAVAERAATEKAAADKGAAEKAAAEKAAAEKAVAEKAAAEHAAAERAAAEKAAADMAAALNAEYWPLLEKDMKAPTARCKREADKVKGVLLAMRKAIADGNMNAMQRYNKKLEDLTFPFAAADEAGRKVLQSYREKGVDVTKFEERYNAACDTDLPPVGE